MERGAERRRLWLHPPLALCSCTPLQLDPASSKEIVKKVVLSSWSDTRRVDMLAAIQLHAMRWQLALDHSTGRLRLPTCQLILGHVSSPEGHVIVNFRNSPPSLLAQRAHCSHKFGIPRGIPTVHSANARTAQALASAAAAVRCLLPEARHPSCRSTRTKR